ncbi:hypothetical protein ABK040_006335 [Willaertia magna]
MPPLITSRLSYDWDFIKHKKENKYLVASASEGVWETPTKDGWTEITLPFACKAVSGGVKFNCFLTENNQIFVTKHFTDVICKELSPFIIDNTKWLIPINIPLLIEQYCNKMEEENDKNTLQNGLQKDLQNTLQKILQNRFEINRMDCSGTSIYIEMKGGFLIKLSSKIDYYLDYLNDKIKILAVCPQYEKAAILTGSNKLTFFGDYLQPVNTQKITKEKIKLMATSPVCTAIVTEDNKLYFNGDDSNSACSGINCLKDFEYLPTIFENESPIIDLKCGYIHTIVLLQNGNIYATGYNDLKQCGHAGSSTTFLLFDKSSILNNKVLGLRCTSRGTVLMTEREAIFIGEVAVLMKCLSSFNYTTCVRVPLNNNNNCKRLYNDSVNINGISMVDSGSVDENFNLELNEVGVGGWHYTVYKKVVGLEKSLIYFKQNLEKIVKNNYNEFMYDIEFIVN